ncbi:MAG: hypothetical protein Q4A27_02045 [bacterium]|nr:hypothetical protein [bacterium]
MKKIITLLAVAMTALLFATNVRAEDYGTFLDRGFEKTGMSNAYYIVSSRKNDKDVRSFYLDASRSPLSSFVSTIKISLKPGESFTINPKQIEGYANTGTATIESYKNGDKNDYTRNEVQLPHTIKYEDLEESQYQDNDISASVRIHNSVIDKNAELQEITTTNFLNEERFSSYNIYAMVGKKLPVAKKMNGSEFQGITFIYGSKETKLFHSSVYKEEFSSYAVRAYYGSTSIGYLDEPVEESEDTGYWEFQALFNL